MPVGKLPLLLDCLIRVWTKFHVFTLLDFLDVLYLVLFVEDSETYKQQCRTKRSKFTNKQRSRHKIRSTRLRNANTGACSFTVECHEILIHLKGFPKRSMVPRRLPTMLLTQQQWRSHCSVTLAHTSVGKLCLFVLIHIHVIPCLSCLILFVYWFPVPKCVEEVLSCVFSGEIKVMLL